MAIFMVSSFLPIAVSALAIEICTVAKAGAGVPLQRNPGMCITPGICRC
jgi:hypothetical protein